MRETYGVTAITRVATGSTMPFGLVPGVAVRRGDRDRREEWNTEVEKTATSRMPVTNSGTPASASRIVWMTVSGRLRR